MNYCETAQSEVLRNCSKIVRKSELIRISHLNQRELEILQSTGSQYRRSFFAETFKHNRKE